MVTAPRPEHAVRGSGANLARAKIQQFAPTMSLRAKRVALMAKERKPGHAVKANGANSKPVWTQMSASMEKLSLKPAAPMEHRPALVQTDNGANTANAQGSSPKVAGDLPIARTAVTLLRGATYVG